MQLNYTFKMYIHFFLSITKWPHDLSLDIRSYLDIKCSFLSNLSFHSLLELDSTLEIYASFFS